MLIRGVSAILTPCRQVKEIRSVFRKHGRNAPCQHGRMSSGIGRGDDNNQFASTDNEYIKQHYDFILDRHRLNVMISRAKTKVVMLMDEFLNNLMK